MLIPSRAAEDLFTGWWQLLAALGAVPRVLVWDGEGAVGHWRGGRPELTAECQGFRGTLATKVLICRSADPEAMRRRLAGWIAAPTALCGACEASAHHEGLAGNRS